MGHKILIALDGSEGAWRAVEYVAKTFGHVPEMGVELLHVLPGLPPAFWDFGHILGRAERESLQGVVAGWESAQEKQWQILVDRARQRLREAGIPDDAVTYTFTRDDNGAADAILREAERGGCDTIVMGRRGLGLARRLLGSVSARVVQEARNRAVTIVE